MLLKNISKTNFDAHRIDIEYILDFELNLIKVNMT